MLSSRSAIPEKRRIRQNAFQSGEMPILAALSFNEFGFSESAKIAEEYVSRALEVLKEAEKLDRETKKAASELRERAERLRADCQYVGAFQENREKFKKTPTQWAVQWTTKQSVRALARWHVTQLHDLLAHKIRRFHAEVSAILNEVSSQNFFFSAK